MECTFCHEKHMVKDEDSHKQFSCVPSLRDKIEKNQLEIKKLKRKREADKKKIEKIERLAKKPRTARYIFTGSANFPTPNHHEECYESCYYKWSNLVKLDHGEMDVCLCLEGDKDGGVISINFYLKTVKKAYVKLNLSLCWAGKVLWQKERTKRLEVESDDENGWTGGDIWDELPSDLPSKLRVVVEVIEWEPNKE